MRSNVSEYEIKAPANLDAVLDALANEPEKWTLFAGGTDIMVLLEAGKLRQKSFLSLWHLNELRGIEEDENSVIIGSLTTYKAIQKSKIIRKYFPMLVQAANETGGLAIQNRGTLGGNIANASPAADSPPALLVYNAEIELTSKSGARWVKYDGFHTGYKQMTLEKGELISRIRIPKPDPSAVQYFKKVGTRRAQAISKVVISSCAFVKDGVLSDIRIAVGSVAPITVRCHKTEDFLKGQTLNSAVIDEATKLFGQEIAPIDDVRSTGRYRRRVAMNLIRDHLESL
jgi:CO/xanthine dehydrogenase FAD-binding subunit